MRNLYGKLRLLIDGTYAALSESLQGDSGRIRRSHAIALEDRVLFSASPVPVELVGTGEAAVQPDSRDIPGSAIDFFNFGYP